MREELRFVLNGEEVSVGDVDPTTTLLYWLREQRGLTGTKEGCNEGDCGACTVSVSSLNGDRLEHRAVNSCILLLAHVDGMAVRTVEGLGTPDRLDPVQQAMVDHHGSQCGFCTPGFVMSLHAGRHEGRRDHDNVLAGNLCRCTGYAPIIRAAEAAADAPAADWLDDEAKALRALRTEGDVALPGIFAPGSYEALFDTLQTHPDATLVGGATDVGLWITKALAEPNPMVFLHRIPELQAVTETDDGLRIGGGVTLARMRGLMAGRHPDLAELIRRFGSVQVRNTATIGGNIANGSPIGDGAPALIALGATLELRHRGGIRAIPLEDFFIAYGEQDLHPGEIVDAIVVPAQTDALGCYKISKRFDQDISALCGCFNVTVENGTITAARIAFGGMAATPSRALHTESALVGRVWDEETVGIAQAALEKDYRPISDLRASAPYRLAVARDLLLHYFEDTTTSPRRLVGRGAIA